MIFFLALPTVARPPIPPPTIMAPPAVATVAPIIPPPGIAIPQTLTRPPAIIQPIPGQPVVIPPPAVVIPPVVCAPVVSILFIKSYLVNRSFFYFVHFPFIFINDNFF